MFVLFVELLLFVLLPDPFRLLAATPEDDEDDDEDEVDNADDEPEPIEEAVAATIGVAVAVGL